MKKNFLAAYITKRLFSIRKDLKNYQKKQKQARIHDLRINIKQIRATFFFLNKIFATKRYPPKVFKKLHKDSGSLRELQVNLRLAKVYQFPETVLSELMENKKNLTPKFLARTPLYLKNIDTQEKRFYLPIQLPRKKELISYFDNQIRKAGTCLKDTENKKNTHLFRKTIKEIMYIYAMLPAKMKKWVGLNEKYLNNLQGRAGKWHDTFAAISFFEQISNAPEGKLAALKAKENKRYNALLKRSQKFETKVYA